MRARGGILSKIRSRFSDRRGQSTMEYILILFIVVMIAVKFRKTIGGKIDNLTNELGNKLGEATQELQ
jgi:hypothetical protein